MTVYAPFVKTTPQPRVPYIRADNTPAEEVTKPVEPEEPEAK